MAKSRDDGPKQQEEGGTMWRRLWRLLRYRLRTLLSLVAMVMAWVLLEPLLPGVARLLAAWNVGAVLWLGLAVVMMARSDVSRMRTRAAQQDDGAALILAVSCAASSACLAAIVLLLGGAPEAAGLPEAARLGLAGITIVSAWLFMHMTFTLHYAHAFYEPHGRQLRFPDKDVEPDYFDFAYFALTIGVACQTADVAICGRRMRRLVTAQSVLAFFFNTAVLALGVNVAASLMGGK